MQSREHALHISTWSAVIGAQYGTSYMIRLYLLIVYSDTSYTYIFPHLRKYHRHILGLTVMNKSVHGMMVNDMDAVYSNVQPMVLSNIPIMKMAMLLGRVLCGLPIVKRHIKC